MKTIVKVIILIALVCFVMPFVVVSCEGHEVAKITGFNLIAGAEVGNSSMMGMMMETQKIDPQPIVICAFAAGILALIAVFIRKYLVSVFAAFTGVISLILFSTNIGKKLMEASGDYEMFKVKLQSGYYLVLILYIVSACLCIYINNEEKRETDTNILGDGDGNNLNSNYD